MTLSPERISAIEIPPDLLESAAVQDLTRTLTSTGELSGEAAGGLARGVLKTMLAAIGEWYSDTVGRDIEAVMALREQLTTRYQETLQRVAGRQGGAAEAVDTQSYQRLFDQMVGYIDRIAAARERMPEGDVAPTVHDATVEALASGQVPYEALPGEAGPAEARTVPDESYLPDDEPSGPLDEPPGRVSGRLPGSRRGSGRGTGTAEASFDRELSRILRELDPPQGRISPRRAVVQRVARYIQIRYLAGSGIPRVRVSRQQVTGAYHAADIALSRFDPIRDTGYEISVDLPPDLRLGGRESVNPDGWSFNGNTFEWLEWKEPESKGLPAGYYSSPQGQLRLLSDLEIRGRLAERVPACNGWRYGTQAGWLADVVDWTVKTLQGRNAGERPTGLTDALFHAVNNLAADRPSWASRFRVAP
jgi:hypothetical protein